MKIFEEFLQGIDDPSQRDRTEEVLAWTAKTYPHLEPAIKWNQPMFTDHGTYIIGFSVAKEHMSVAPEQAAMTRFETDIEQAGYNHTKELFRIPWKKQLDYNLLEKMIDFNISDKADCTTFWRE
ncbi:iron chaperone [Metaplanococcus flavidus]|uniref:Iron chaperone n=1 Tax=Metaplanococcus flavidus TaxID=569883 RepID=A0ABW3LE07_9BACL